MNGPIRCSSLTLKREEHPKLSNKNKKTTSACVKHFINLQSSTWLSIVLNTTQSEVFTVTECNDSLLSRSAAR
jgi:hypothetical protein